MTFSEIMISAILYSMGGVFLLIIISYFVSKVKGGQKGPELTKAAPKPAVSVKQSAPVKPVTRFSTQELPKNVRKVSTKTERKVVYREVAKQRRYQVLNQEAAQFL